jgi:hypothetical protein
MSQLYGLMAEFRTPEEIIVAAEKARDEGYRMIDAYTPFPVDGLAQAIGFKKNKMPLITLLGGIAGGALAYWLQYYASVLNYPLNIGGRPYHSWPAFIPVTFELTILGAAFAAVFGMLLMNGLPKPYHPVFNCPEFSRASSDRFYLCVQSCDPLFDLVYTRRFLDSIAFERVYEVQP